MSRRGVTLEDLLIRPSRAGRARLRRGHALPPSHRRVVRRQRRLDPPLAPTPPRDRLLRRPPAGRPHGGQDDRRALRPLAGARVRAARRHPGRAAPAPGGPSPPQHGRPSAGPAGLAGKKKVLRAAEQDRPDVQHKRACWRGRARRVDPERFVFLDEVGAHTSLTRLYGRAPRGVRLVDAVPAGTWETTTLVSAIRRDGVVASLAFAGATDEAAFQTYLDHVLIPALRPGDIVVLDNLSVHHRPAVARALRRAGAGVWYLPPYSLDYNPIEKIWAKVKAFLRKAGARTTEALWDAFAQALRTVTAEDCQNSFAHCGYPATNECEVL